MNLRDEMALTVIKDFLPKQHLLNPKYVKQLATVAYWVADAMIEISDKTYPGKNC